MHEPEPPLHVPLDSGKLLGALDRHRVAYVLIGGLGAVAHGFPEGTADADITPALTRENLKRLAKALTALDAQLLLRERDRDRATVVAWRFDDHAFDAFQTVSTRTRYGDLDVSFRPDAPKPQGFFDYIRLNKNAVEKRAFGLRIRVAALEDIIASKSAAGRPRDLAKLPGLRNLLARLEDTRG
jgi:hypothetical protein